MVFFMIMDFLIEKGSTSPNNGHYDRKKDRDTLHHRQRTVDLSKYGHGSRAQWHILLTWFN